MGFPFLTVALWAASFIVTALLRPDLSNEQQKPKGLDEFDFPTAEEGRPVPVVWGRGKITGPNMIWSGDYRVDEALEENGGFLFFGGGETLRGFRYYLGMQYALCRGTNGPVDLLRVWIDDRIVYDWATILPIEGGDTFTFNKPNHWGGEGEDTNWQGGIYYSGTFYDGTQTTADTYIDGIEGTVPAYIGTANIVFEQAWLGNRASVPKISFELERYPQLLFNTQSTGDYVTNSAYRVNNGSNPMEVLYELLISDEYGLNLSNVDEVSFVAAGNTLYSEGNGFSFVWDKTMEVSDLIDLVEEQVDGVLYIDQTDGLFKFKLMRDDYDTGTLTTLDETVVSSATFTRADWTETKNYLRMRYTSDDRDWKESLVPANDLAAEEIVGATSLEEIRFPGVADGDLAVDLVWRELTERSYPWAKMTLELNRENYDIEVGDVFKFSWSLWNVTDKIVRVLRVDYGRITDGKIRIDVIEDHYFTQVGSSGTPDLPGWTIPTEDAVALTAANQAAMEAPAGYTYIYGSLGEGSPTSYPRMLTLGKKVSGSGTQYRIYERNNASTPITGGAYTLRGTILSLTGKRCTLDANLAGLTSSFPTDGEFDFTVTPADSENFDSIVNSGFATHTDTDKNYGFGLAVINPGEDNEEWVIVESITDGTGDKLDLVNVRRGALDTAVHAHSSGDSIWLVQWGGAGLSDVLPTLNQWYDPLLVPGNWTGDFLDTSDAVAMTEFKVESHPRYVKPYLPDELDINGVRYPSSVSSSYTLPVAGVGGFLFAVEPKDWRNRSPWAALEHLAGDSELSNTNYFATAGAFDIGTTNPDNLSFNWWLYDLDSTPNPTPRDGGGDAVASGTESAGTTSWEVTAASLSPAPTYSANMRIEIEAEHDPEFHTSYTNVKSRQLLTFDFTATT